MVYRIQDMSHSAQEQAKQQLAQMVGRKTWFGYGYSVYDLPYVVGVGVGDGVLVVTVDADRSTRMPLYSRNRYRVSNNILANVSVCLVGRWNAGGRTRENLIR